MNLVNQIKIPGFRGTIRLASKSQLEECKRDGGKRKLQRWEYLQRLSPQRGKAFFDKRKEEVKAEHKLPRRTVSFGRPVFEPERNEWEPEITRSVPVNLVLRRRSDVGLPRRPSVAEPTVMVPRKLVNMHYNDDVISEVDEEQEDVQTENIRRKSVSIKLD